MTSYNKVILLGNLTRDTEVRYTPNGNAVANFTIAVNRKYKQGDETKEEVSYIDIVVYGKQAESCGQYLAKGDAVLVDGRLNQRRWEDKDSGQKRSKMEVIAQGTTFMPKKSGVGANSESAANDNSVFEEGNGLGLDAGEIPF